MAGGPASFDVAGLGASAIDLVYVLPAYPRPEGPLSKLPVQSHHVSAGGQTATAMAGCAALGLRAAFLGPTGNDAHGALVREALAQRGVDLSMSPFADGPQAHSIILLAHGHAERIVLWSRGKTCKPFPVEFSRLKVLHVDDVYLDAAIEAAAAAREAGCLVTTDIDQVTDRTNELLALATHPILAEHVPEALSGVRGLEPALRALRAHTRAPIVVTLGSRGAMLLEGDDVRMIEGFAVKAVDTTGAGDVFRSGFITALIEGQPLSGVVRFANAAAAISVTRGGAMASVPSRADVEALLTGRDTM